MNCSYVYQILWGITSAANNFFHLPNSLNHLHHITRLKPQLSDVCLLLWVLQNHLSPWTLFSMRSDLWEIRTNGISKMKTIIASKTQQYLLKCIPKETKAAPWLQAHCRLTYISKDMAKHECVSVWAHRDKQMETHTHTQTLWNVLQHQKRVPWHLKEVTWRLLTRGSHNVALAGLKLSI